MTGLAGRPVAAIESKIACLIAPRSSTVGLRTAGVAPAVLGDDHGKAGVATTSALRTMSAPIRAMTFVDVGTGGARPDPSAGRCVADAAPSEG
jgi:hypothetical protein